MKSFWYEQSPVLTSGDIGGDVYKSDGGFIRDGQWHRLNPQSEAMYRVMSRYLQVVFLDKEVGSSDPSADMSEILAAVESAGPLTLYENDQPEILIRPLEGGGYEMTSHFIFLGTGAGLINFTPEQWNNAYERLRDLISNEE